MSYLDSNVPFKISYASVGSEIVHIVRATADMNNMVTSVNILLTLKLIKRKMVNLPVSFHYWKTSLGHSKVFHKFTDRADGLRHSL